LAGVFIGGEEVFLDSDIDPQILVHGAINGRHTALSEDLDNPVAPIEQ
jgi:hypothetical protein